MPYPIRSLSYLGFGLKRISFKILQKNEIEIQNMLIIFFKAFKRVLLPQSRGKIFTVEYTKPFHKVIFFPVLTVKYIT